MADVTLDLIYQKTMQIEQLVQSLPQNLSVINAEQVNAQFLSAISANLGTVTAGELRVGTPNVAPGNGFSGLRLKWPPMTYEGEQWNLVGVNDDVFQVGIRSNDGTLRAGGGHIIIDSAGLRSDNFVSGISGFTINQPNGDAEFNNVLIRGELRSTVFVKGLIEAHAGTLIISKSAGVLYEDMYVPPSGTWYMRVLDPPGGGFLFDNGDICRIKAEYSGGISDLWVSLSNRLQYTGYQRYTCTWQDGTRDITFPERAPAVDYGASGQGTLSMSADGLIGAGANMSIMTHAGSPWTTETLRTRIGNMRDSYGTGANNRYGFGVGDYSSGNYLSYNAEAVDKFIMKAGEGNVQISETGLSIEASSIGGETQKQIKFLGSLGTPIGVIEAYQAGSGFPNKFYINSMTHGGKGADLVLAAPSSDKVQVLTADMYIENDVYTAPWTNYYSSSTVVGWSSFTNSKIYYKKVGKLVYVSFQITGTSNSSSASFTLPYTNANPFVRIPIAVTDNGVIQAAPGRAQMGLATDEVIIGKTLTSDGGFTASGNKGIYGQFFYETTS